MERQYIGARYVPKFADPVVWNKALSYEAMTIVTYLGNSFTSKKPVPAGIEIGNNEYWVNTGNYNAQVEEYRQSVIHLENSLSAINATNPPSGYAAMSVDSADNSAAFQALVDNFECVFIPSGNYTLANTITIANNTKIIGNGTLVRASGNRYGDILHVTGCTLAISGITINDNGSTLPVFTSADYDIPDKRYVCINIDNGAKIDVNWCTFKDVYTRAIGCYKAPDISICNNYMETTTRNQGYVGEFVHIQTCYGTLSICNNKMNCPDYTDSKFGMCGIYVAGFNYGAGNILDNIMGTVGRDNTFGHRLLPIDFYEDVHNVTVRGNKIKSAHGFIRIEGCDNVTVESNVVKKESNYMHPSGDPAIWIYTQVGDVTRDTKNIKVSNNNIDMNATESIIQTSGPNLENIVIENNIIKKSNTGASYFRLVNTSNVTILNNTIYTDGTNNHMFLRIYGNYSEITIDKNNVKNIDLACQVENNGVGENIIITDNYFELNNDSPIRGCTINNSIVRGNMFTRGNVDISGSNTIVTENIINHNYVYNGNAIAVNNVRNGVLYPPQG